MEKAKHTAESAMEKVKHTAESAMEKAAGHAAGQATTAVEAEVPVVAEVAEGAVNAEVDGRATTTTTTQAALSAPAAFSAPAALPAQATSNAAWSAPAASTAALPAPATSNAAWSVPEVAGSTTESGHATSEAAQSAASRDGLATTERAGRLDAAVAAPAPRLAVGATGLRTTTPEPGQTFYRRPLPESLVPFASVKGKELFRRALQESYMDCYFGLAGNFMTQAEPAYCGLSCLAMVLNTLEVDPGRRWKGVWRWYSEDMLDCCTPLERVKSKGITFEEFACLAQCNGLQIESHHADSSTKDEFMAALRSACSSTDRVLVVSYSRQAMRQTGDGHFSPVGGYDAASNMVLVLDVARFKYPSYWVSADLLWESLHPVDAETGRSRGYFVASKSQGRSPSVSLLRLTLDKIRWATLATDLCTHVAKATTISALVRGVLQALGPLGMPVELRNAGRDLAGPGLESEVMKEALQLRLDAQSHSLYGIVVDAIHSTSGGAAESEADVELRAALTTMFLLSLPQWVYPTKVAQLMAPYYAERERSATLRDEIGRIRHQMASLESFVQCSCNKPASACTSGRVVSPPA